MDMLKYSQSLITWGSEFPFVQFLNRYTYFLIQHLGLPNKFVKKHPSKITGNAIYISKQMIPGLLLKTGALHPFSFFSDIFTS
jgi:hypothetical protein